MNTINALIGGSGILIAIFAYIGNVILKRFEKLFESNTDYLIRITLLEKETINLQEQIKELKK